MKSRIFSRELGWSLWICSIGSLVWALTKGVSDHEGAFDCTGNGDT